MQKLVQDLSYNLSSILSSNAECHPQHPHVHDRFGHFICCVKLNRKYLHSIRFMKQENNLLATRKRYRILPDEKQGEKQEEKQSTLEPIRAEKNSAKNVLKNSLKQTPQRVLMIKRLKSGIVKTKQSHLRQSPGDQECDEHSKSLIQCFHVAALISQKIKLIQKLFSSSQIEGAVKTYFKLGRPYLCAINGGIGKIEKIGRVFLDAQTLDARIRKTANRECLMQLRNFLEYLLKTFIQKSSCKLEKMCESMKKRMKEYEMRTACGETLLEIFPYPESKPLDLVNFHTDLLEIEQNHGSMELICAFNLEVFSTLLRTEQQINSLKSSLRDKALTEAQGNFFSQPSIQTL